MQMWINPHTHILLPTKVGVENYKNMGVGINGEKAGSQSWRTSADFINKKVLGRGRTRGQTFFLEKVCYGMNPLGEFEIVLPEGRAQACRGEQ